MPLNTLERLELSPDPTHDVYVEAVFRAPPDQVYTLHARRVYGQSSAYLDMAELDPPPDPARPDLLHLQLSLVRSTTGGDMDGWMTDYDDIRLDLVRGTLTPWCPEWSLEPEVPAAARVTSVLWRQLRALRPDLLGRVQLLALEHMVATAQPDPGRVVSRLLAALPEALLGAEALAGRLHTGDRDCRLRLLQLTPHLVAERQRRLGRRSARAQSRSGVSLRL